MLLRLEQLCCRRRHAIVLLYHHVRADDDAIPPLSMVEEGVTAAAFKAQLSALRRWYQPGTSAQLSQALSGESSLAEDILVVTFDDGYQDNRTLAGPILRSLQLRGLVFIATGYIESQRKFWWVALNDVVRALPPDRPEMLCMERDASGFSLLTPSDLGTDLASIDARRKLRKRLAERMRPLSLEEKDRHLSYIASRLEGPSDTGLPLLSWQEMREMAVEGFEFGAHTINHPHLTRLSGPEANEEVNQSAASLTTQLGSRPKAFAYPHGDFNDGIEDIVKAASFGVAYAANPGIAIPGKTNLFRVPRIQLESTEAATLEALIVALKLSKYCPAITRPLLTRFFGARFEA